MLKLTTTLIISLALSLVSTFSFAQVTADFTVDKANVCDGNATVAYTDNSSSGADDWIWTFTNGTPSSATGKGPHVVTYAPGKLGAQSVTLLVQDKSKLPSVVTNTVTKSLVTVNPLPEVYIDSDQTICQGTSAKLDFGIINGTPNYSIIYKYYPLASPSSFVNVSMSGLTSLNDTLMVSPSQTTVYSITSVTDSKGCKATVDLTKEVTIVVTPRPNVTIDPGVPQPIIICSGSTVGASLVSTVVGTSFDWTVATPPNNVLGITNPGAGVVIADALENNSGKDATVVYTVTSMYLGCSGNTIDIPVKVRAKTEPLLLDKDNICPNDVVKLKTGIFPSGVSPLGTYTWDVDGVTQASNRDTLDIAVDKNVIVTVVYTDICGDYHVSNAAVLNTKQEVILDFVKGDSCVNSVIPFTPINISDLSNTTVVDSWNWNFGNNIATSTSQNPIATTQFNKDGEYLVTLNAISEGCNVGEIINSVKIYNCAAGLQEDEVISSMFPNPTTDLVNISLTNTYNGNVNLFDSKGSKVFSAGFFGDKVTLSTIDLPNGLYMVLIDTTTGFKAKQLLMINK